MRSSIVTLRSGLMAVLLMACMAGSFGADLVVPGQKSVKHEIRFTNLASFPEFAFQLELPAEWNRAPIPLAEGEPVSFYKFLDARLVVRPANSLATDPSGIVARSSMEFHLHTSASESSPVARRLSTYEVVAIKAGVIEVLDLGTVQFDAAGRVLGSTRNMFLTGGFVPLVIIGLAGLLLVGYVVWRRRLR